MNIQTVATILGAVEALTNQIPALVASAKLAADLIVSGRAPTADEQAEIDEALDKSHAALQAAQPAA